MPIDMNEDFEFKPLTEGLGFHKKTIELKEELFKSLETQTGILPTPKAKPFNYGNGLPLTQVPVKPTGQPAAKPGQKPAPLNWGPLVNKDFVEDKTKQKLSPIPSNWAASVFDMAMVAGITLLFSAVVFVVLSVDLSTLVSNIQSDFGIQLSSIAVIFAVLEIYTVSTRTFFGKTLGEWVFDSRLGTPEEQTTFFYPLQVAWRTFVISLTGFFILPALSSAIGEDIAGILSGVKLYSENK